MMMKLINLVIPPAPAPPEYGPATNRSRSWSSRMQPPPLLSAQGRDKLNMRSLELLNFTSMSTHYLEKAPSTVYQQISLLLAEWAY